MGGIEANRPDADQQQGIEVLAAPDQTPVQTRGREAVSMGQAQNTDYLAGPDPLSDADRSGYRLISGPSPATDVNNHHWFASDTSSEDHGAGGGTAHGSSSPAGEVNSSMTGTPTHRWWCETMHDPRTWVQGPNPPGGRAR